eukprot:m.262445 g.262445  ORF g.262445 m.262445 type:complete len:327 (-) comp45677_c0_seq1:24-1004(-)
MYTCSTIITSTTTAEMFSKVCVSEMAVMATLLAVVAHVGAVSVNAVASKTGFATTTVGNQLHRDYGVYASMPITHADAVSQGWVLKTSTQCVPGLGIEYVQTRGGDDAAKPLSLYFTPAGQITGAGVFALGKNSPNLIKRGFWIPNGTLNGYDRYYISVSFRNEEDSCSMTLLPDKIGNQLIVNGGSLKMPLPLTRDDAQQNGWVKGSCFADMGTHWFLDVTGANMSWTAANLMPIVVMFDEQSANADNEINAIFFATPDRQQTVFPPSANQWEPIPLPNFAMCKNFCDKACTFSDTSLFSTLHLFFKNYTQVTCHGGCSIGCCGN